MILTPKSITDKLKPHSEVCIESQCDECGKITTTTYSNYTRSQEKRNWTGKTFCRKCATRIAAKNRIGKPSPFKGVARADMRGKNHPSWNGGSYIDSSGYKMIHVKSGHADCGWGSYSKEHRVVMEQYLGRKLKKGETIHHIDGNKLNNNINNLALFNTDGEHHRLAHTSLQNIGYQLYIAGFIEFDNVNKQYMANLKLRELLGYLDIDNQQPSLENDNNVSRKVQRLDGEESTNNPSTSAEQVYPDDIVRPTT